MAAIVKCAKCGQSFDRDKTPFIVIPVGQVRKRYAHQICPDGTVNVNDDGTQKGNIITSNNICTFFQQYLEPDMILKATDYKYINSQIDNLKIQEFSIEGIFFTLKYYFTILHSKNKQMQNELYLYGLTSIVPRYYQEASRYVHRVNTIRQDNRIQVEKNKDKSVTINIPIQTSTITIPREWRM